MHVYLVYVEGVELVDVYIKARSHNEAERKAKQKYGENTTVAYTEL
jgi:glutaredoxin